jgi:sulfate/thiosulfate transport system permease protein
MAVSSIRSISPATDAALAEWRPRQAWRGNLPGFAPTLGLTLFFLTLLVIVPLASLFVKTASLSPAHVLALLATPRILAAFRLSFGLAIAAAILNGAIGTVIAWVLVRYDFKFRRFFDAIIDLPFGLPTAVAGIALTALYADSGWVGGLLAPFGIAIAFTPLGIFLALLFVGLPYVIRSVQPVLAAIERDGEEAALTLGASSPQTFRRVIAPQLMPALLTGTALAFSRGVGEYGSVIFIAGNVPGVSEILPLVIMTRLEQFDYAGASAVAVVMLLFSLSILLALNLLQGWTRRRHGG